MTVFDHLYFYIQNGIFVVHGRWNVVFEMHYVSTLKKNYSKIQTHKENGEPCAWPAQMEKYVQDRCVVTLMWLLANHSATDKLWQSIYKSTFYLSTIFRPSKQKLGTPVERNIKIRLLIRSPYSTNNLFAYDFLDTNNRANRSYHFDEFQQILQQQLLLARASELLALLLLTFVYFRLIRQIRAGAVILRQRFNQLQQVWRFQRLILKIFYDIFNTILKLQRRTVW